MSGITFWPTGLNHISRSHSGSLMYCVMSGYSEHGKHGKYDVRNYIYVCSMCWALETGEWCPSHQQSLGELRKDPVSGQLT